MDDDGDDDDDNSWQGPLSTAAKPNESEMALGSPECGGRTAFGGRRGDEVVAEEREEDAAKFADATDKDGKFTRTESAREREGRNQRISAPDEGQRASEVNSDLERPCYRAINLKSQTTWNFWCNLAKSKLSILYGSTLKEILREQDTSGRTRLHEERQSQLEKHCVPTRRARQSKR